MFVTISPVPCQLLTYAWYRWVSIALSRFILALRQLYIPSGLSTMGKPSFSIDFGLAASDGLIPSERFPRSLAAADDRGDSREDAHVPNNSTGVHSGDCAQPHASGSGT